ncbi:DNA-binding transcriptional regulator LsrR, DeoR family [Faunimonas pinastri]|uniref:DNA-binding transcriptional regulator LsrR, DeoR family n=1 Tax=Faunimonas pinastri TaxID=1855383 RepID=A0A1H9C3Y2_9HYPH|nr:sugar-binding transcriptional regulator [Faunimonas pinastri]SEP95543.1 DNA-binding transcriptional regulator LsrR, DeoR family [Faunimonas pinastri]
MPSPDADSSRLDDAARAGWLYFIAGNTQDEIARKLNVSRATAQRLVSLSRSERLITFRLEHPIAACMELSQRLQDRYALKHCDVVPTDPASASNLVGIAEAAGSFLEQRLRSDEPTIFALGTGRSLRAAVDHIPPMNCPSHTLVSLVGNISPDGSASFFDVLTRLGDLTRAKHYPMPLPVVAPSRSERDQFLSLAPVRKVRSLAEKADVTLVGVGQLDDTAPLFVDGFITRKDLDDLRKMGAVGDVAGWVFDENGRIVEGSTNERVTSVPPQPDSPRLVIGVAMGASKVAAVEAALKGRLINGLITNEKTAAAILGS